MDGRDLDGRDDDVRDESVSWKNWPVGFSVGGQMEELEKALSRLNATSTENRSLASSVPTRLA